MKTNFHKHKSSFLISACKLIFTIIAISASACNNKKDDTSQVNNPTAKEVGTSNTPDAKVDRSMKEMVGQYLQMKNALANDNGKDAATAGNAFVESMGKMEKTSLTTEKLKIWDDLSDDAKEMAEHIGKNADDIEHQRDHFSMLSEDMYDMVKSFGAGQTLYQYYCPMYHDNKGATWLSETKEIKNPYLGKKMPTCGSLKEELNK